MSATEIFVYGTLKRGGINHRQMEGQEYVGEARTAPRYRLYQLDGYPGMVEAPAGAEGVSVVGEIWRVDAACLKRLDEFEGVAEGLYQRVELQLDGAAQRPRVQTYLYLRSVAGRRDLGNCW